MTAVARKRNVPGYTDEFGRFRPIRLASFVGSGSSRRPAKVRDRKKYSKAKAGDLGKVKQERALEDVFDRQIRLDREAAAAQKKHETKLQKEIEADVYGHTSEVKAQTLAQFVRSAGGIRRTFKHDGAKFRGKRSGWDSGEIDRLTRKGSGSSGLTTSRSDRGKTMDYMFQAARESGYDVTSIDDMMERIENEVTGGKPTYPTHGSLSYNPRKRNGFTHDVVGATNVFLFGYTVDEAENSGHKLRELTIAARKLIADGHEFQKRQVTGLKSLGFSNYRYKGQPPSAKNPKTPSAARLAKAAIAVFDEDLDLDLDAKDVRILEKSKGKKVKTNPDLLSMFANGAVGIASALQIKEYMNRPKRKAAAKQRGTTKAKANPVRRSTPKPPADLLGEFYLMPFAAGGNRKPIVQLCQGTNMYKEFPTTAAARAFAAKHNIRLAANPTPKANPTPRCSCGHIREGHVKEVGKCSLCTCSKFKRKAFKTLKAVATAMRKAPARKNPKTTARRRTFEMFQGRKATTARPMVVSNHAPATLDQLGDLIELKIAGGPTLKFNGRSAKLCAANGKLWIAGKRFAKANPAAKANEINPVGEIDHVVYGTFKPHHGDHNYTHYIHKLGEESGKRPLLCIDREGYPVIRGGNYTIEARGIVD